MSAVVTFPSDSRTGQYSIVKVQGVRIGYITTAGCAGPDGRVRWYYFPDGGVYREDKGFISRADCEKWISDLIAAENNV